MTILKLVHLCTLLVLLLANKPSMAQNQVESRPFLAEFLQTIIDTHPALDEAQALLMASKARARGQSRPLYNPELEVEYENSEVATSTVGLSQTIDWSGKRKSRYNVSEAEMNIAMAQLKITKKKLISEILLALSDYQLNLQIHQLNEKRVLLGEEFLSLAKVRNTSGDLSLGELLSVRLNLVESKSKFGLSEISLMETEEKLLTLTGLDREKWPNLLGIPKNMEISKLFEKSLELPEIQLAKANSALYNARIKQAQKERSPDPTLGVKYGEEGNTDLFGVRLSVPLPVRNSFRAEVQASRSDYLAAEKNEQLVFKKSQAYFKTSFRKFDVAKKAWLNWVTEGETPLKDQARLIQTLWKNGEINAVSYLVQQQQSFNTQEASIQSNSTLWRTWFELLDATNNIDQWMENIR